jgi:hypothetical protein
MQEFLGAFLSAVSYFLTSYFLYRILGGRKLIPLLFYSVILMSGLLSLIGAIQSQLGFSIILMVFMTQLLPVFVAFFFFYSVTGVKPMIRIRFRKRFKELPMDIQTKRQSIYVIFALIGVALVIGVIGLIFSEGITQILSYVITSSLIILSIVLFFQIKNIQSESVILLVGKDKEFVYEYTIEPEKTKVLVSDFYKNPMFIVDKIGEVDIKNESKKVTKHHLYWIATSSKVDMSKENVKKLNDVPYRDYLDRFEKYHFKRVQLSINPRGDIHFIKETTIR